MSLLPISHNIPLFSLVVLLVFVFVAYDLQTKRNAVQEMGATRALRYYANASLGAGQLPWQDGPVKLHIL